MAHPDFISQTHSPESWPWPWPFRHQSSAASPAWCWLARGCRPAAGQNLMGSPRAVEHTAPPGSPAPEWCRHGWAWRRRHQCWSWRWRVCKDQRNEIIERMRWREGGRMDEWLFQQIPTDDTWVWKVHDKERQDRKEERKGDNKERRLKKKNGRDNRWETEWKPNRRQGKTEGRKTKREEAQKETRKQWRKEGRQKGSGEEWREGRQGK